MKCSLIGLCLLYVKVSLFSDSQAVLLLKPNQPARKENIILTAADNREKSTRHFSIVPFLKSKTMLGKNEYQSVVFYVYGILYHSIILLRFVENRRAVTYVSSMIFVPTKFNQN